MLVSAHTFWKDMQEAGMRGHPWEQGSRTLWLVVRSGRQIWFFTFCPYWFWISSHKHVLCSQKQISKIADLKNKLKKTGASLHKWFHPLQCAFLPCLLKKSPLHSWWSHLFPQSVLPQQFVLISVYHHFVYKFFFADSLLWYLFLLTYVFTHLQAPWRQELSFIFVLHSLNSNFKEPLKCSLSEWL